MIKNLKDTAINVATFVFFSFVNIVFILPLAVLLMVLNKYK
jgi:hypothetical protein